MSARRLPYLVIAIILLQAASHAQPVMWKWVSQVSTNGTELAADAAVDPLSGDIYVGGYYDTDLSSILGGLFLNPLMRDGLVARYTPTGSLVSAFSIGGLLNDEIKAVACDGSGNLYVAGYFNLIVDFDPSAASYPLTAGGFRDGFLAKYNPSGVLQWSVKFGGLLTDEATDIFVSGTDVFVTGFYQNSATFYSTNSVTAVTGSPLSGQSFFGAKYDQAGVVQWVVTGGSSGTDAGLAVCADGQRAYFAGTYDGAFTVYDVASSAVSTLSAQGTNNNDAFVIAFSNSGSFEWATNAASNGDDGVQTITQDAGNVYVGGWYRNTVSLPYPAPTFTRTSAGGNDMLLAAITKSTGTFNWLWQQNGSGASDEKILNVTKTTQGEFILSGSFKGVLSYTSQGGPLLVSSGNEDLFVTALQSNGAHRWSTAGGGGNVDAAYGVVTSSSGAVYVVGEYANAASFGSLNLLNMNSSNIFVAATGCETITNNVITGSQTVCAGGTVTPLSGSTPSGGVLPYSFRWEQSVDNITWTPAAGIHSLSISYSPAPVNQPIFFRRFVAYSGGCPSESNTITIIPVAPPGPAAAPVSQTVCSNSFTLSAPSPTTGVGQWSVLSGTATILAPLLPVSQANNLSAGLNVFVWTLSNAPCANASSTVTVQRDLPPSPAIAGNNQTVCATVATLNAQPPSVGSGTWTLISGTATVIQSTNVSTGITGMASGTNIFSWSVSNGVCPVSTATTMVQRDLPPTVASAGANQTICAANSTLSANLPSIGTGSWSLAAGSASLHTPASPTTPISDLAVGSNTFSWTISNGVCAPSTSTVNVVRQALPGPVVAGVNQTICASFATLSAQSPSAGTGNWAVVSGGATITNSASAVTPVSNLSVGVNVFNWTITNGVCPPGSATVGIWRDASPGTALAGSNQSVCASSFTLNATPPSAGSGTWSVLQGTANLVSGVTASPAVNGLSPGANVFEWTISNGICPSSSATVSVWRDLPPSPSDAGPDQQVCSANATLAAVSPASGAGTWSVVTGGSTINNNALPDSPVSTLSVSVNKLIWIVSNGVCPMSVDTVRIERFLPPTTATVSANQTLCTGSSTVGGNMPVVGTGSWAIVTGASSVTAPFSPTTAVTNLNPGFHQLSWNIANGTCPISSATIDIQVDQLPDNSIAGNDQQVCGSTASLAGNTPVSGEGVWIVISGSGTVSTPTLAMSSVTALSEGANQLVWEITNGVCPVSRDTTSIFSDAAPSPALAHADSAVCLSQVPLHAVVPVKGSGGWHVLSGNGQLQSNESPTTTVSGLSNGPNVFVWRVENGACAPASDTITVFRDLPPSEAEAGKDTTICGNLFTLNAATPGTGSGRWEIISGDAAITASSSPQASVVIHAEGNHLVRWTITNGVCSPSSDTLDIMVHFPPGPIGADTETVTCSPEFVLSASQPTSGTGLWSLSSGTAVILTPTQSATVIKTAPGENEFLWTVVNGTCPEKAMRVKVRRDTVQTSASAGADIETDLFTVTLAAEDPAAGTGRWRVVEGTATIADPRDPRTMLTELTPGFTTLRWEVDAGACGLSSDELRIYVKPFDVPNAFSPNGDGKNDAFVITGLQNYHEVRFTVFNRYGGVVFEKENYENDWNGCTSSGLKLPDDTYYYVLEIPGLRDITGYVMIKTTR